MRSHPEVAQPPTDFSEYGGGDLFSEWMISMVFWVLEFIGLTEPGKHYRVEPGRYELQGQPKTVFRMIENFIMVDKYVKGINWLTLYHGHFWLLMLCTVSYWAGDNSYPYCYDNIWADVVLENGQPPENTIYSVIDLFTWEGFIYVWALFCFRYFIEIFAEWLAYMLIFMIYYFMVQDQPFCVPGEINIAGWDFCDNTFM